MATAWEIAWVVEKSVKIPVFQLPPLPVGVYCRAATYLTSLKFSLLQLRLLPASDIPVRQSLRHWDVSKFMWTHNISEQHILIATVGVGTCY